MKPLLAQITSVLGCLICLYAALWVGSVILVPPDRGGAELDTSQAQHSLYMTEPKYIYLNRAPLERPGPKVILVGASNTVVGFRQHDLASLVNDAAVDNLAIGGANITETAQVIDLAAQTEPYTSLQRTTFVIGLWYGMFGSNREWWFSSDRHAGDTDIDIERYRYGFCWRTASGPLPLVPPRDIDTAALAIHPYLVAEKLVRDITALIDTRLLGHSTMRTEQQRNDTIIDEAERTQLLSYWMNRIGSRDSLPPEQFEVLRQLISKILASGASVVLVDLPLPNWHAARSPYISSYYRQLQPIVDAFAGSPNFRFTHLSGLSADNDFSDEVHPKPNISAQWSRQLANLLNEPSAHQASL